MPRFLYAFIQKEDKVFSCLKRNNDGQPFFDMVLFGERRYLSADDTEFWKKWREETSFCDKIDLADLIFIVPTDSSLPIPKTIAREKTGWRRDDMKRLLDIRMPADELRNANISGDIDSAFTIDGTPYKVIRYMSEILPDKAEAIEKGEAVGREVLCPTAEREV